MLKQIYDAGFAQYIYFGFHILGFAAVLFFNLTYSKKWQISAKDALITTWIAYPIAYLWIYVLCWIETGFRRFGGNNIVRGFIYIPLIVYPIAKWRKISWGRMCDFLAPCICVCHGISHIGCIFVGCCNGYSCSWGIYNPFTESVLFPIQLLEAATALAIVAILLIRAKKCTYRSDGTYYPVMLILFGSTRFLWEFFRNNEKLWLGCSSLAFHALFMFAVGLAVLLHLRKKHKGKALRAVSGDLKKNRGYAG